MEGRAEGVAIVRRIDDLGRVVIPKEFRKYLKVTEGDAVMFYATSDGNVLIVKKPKPQCKLIGENGNTLNLVGIAARVLREHDMRDEAKEMEGMVFDSHSYNEALRIIGQYVDIV